jgi:hypothetical protein
MEATVDFGMPNGGNPHPIGGTESGKRRQLQMTACGHTSPIQVITSSFWSCYAQAIQADNPLSHFVVPLTHSALRPFR